MPKIPDQLIRLAADWIADQERDPFEDRRNAPLSLRRPCYYRRAYRELTRVAQECEDNDCSIVGKSVFRGRDEQGKTMTARVVIRGTIVLGYFDFDTTPAFSWPPEIREKIIARAAARSGAV